MPEIRIILSPEKDLAMKLSELPALLAFLAFAAFPARAQEVICVDSVHYYPQAACPAIYIPLCGCDGSDPGNDCEAFVRGALSCWSQKCPRIDLGCEVDFAYTIEGDQLLLQDQSPTEEDDEVASWEWQNDYETFATGSPQAILEMPPGQMKFKVSLGIRTTRNCIAYCTYLIDRTVGSGREAAAAEPSVFPNPAAGDLHIRNTFGYRRLQLFGLDGRLLLDQPLRGAALERAAVGRLSPGIYLAALAGDSGSRTFKVMVR